MRLGRSSLDCWVVCCSGTCSMSWYETGKITTWLLGGLLFRDVFYELIRDWEDHHLTAGWSVRQCQSEKIRSLINIGRDSLANCLHLARLFVLQLIQVRVKTVHPRTGNWQIPSTLWYVKIPQIFILLQFLQMLMNFCNIWPTVYWVNLQHNDYSLLKCMKMHL